MQENTNKIILINTTILYFRLGITAICGLLTTRYALKALGVDDFGVFAVVGSVISFVAIINTIMLGTSNRFIASAIGKNNKDLINDTFNINLIIHIAIAVATVLVAMPIGEWYINNYINYSGDIRNIIVVFDISIIGSAISFIGVPYNGLLLAKERFFVFCITDVIASIVKLIVSFLLIYFFEAKLFIYAMAIGVTTAFPTIVFYLYCKNNFSDFTNFYVVRNLNKYREVFTFSIWVGYGAVATIGKTQGAAIVVNIFFNTVMNTALGIANSVNAILLTFANNLTKSLTPQIVKSYSSGNYKRSETLVITASRLSYLFMLFISAPFFLAPNFIFQIWLGEVPKYVISFTTLIIIDALIGTLNAGIPDLVFATGKIKTYQIILNSILLLSIPLAYLVLREGYPAYSMIVAYIFVSLIALVVRQIVLNKLVKFNNIRLLKEAYFPCFLVTILFLPFLYFHTYMNVIYSSILGMLYLCILILCLGMNCGERRYFILIMKKLLNRK